MSSELDAYRKELRRIFDKLCEAVGGLSEHELNWHPPVAEANSIYAITTHTLGNARAWILGICCGQPIKRDRFAEFRAEGDSAADLMSRARDVGSEAEQELSRLDPASLDELRNLHPELTSRRPLLSVSRRDAVVHAIAHASEHFGHITLTRDLVRARAGAR